MQDRSVLRDGEALDDAIHGCLPIALKLTPGQASRLEKGEQRLQNNEKEDMAEDNGHLTRQDRRQLNREANHMSAPHR